MVIRRNWTEIVENAGEQTFDLLDDLGEVARDFVCDLWYRFPDKLAGGAGVLGAFPRGYMNKACLGKPLPDPPTVPFAGGQCCEKTYIVDVYVQIKICFDHRIIMDGIRPVEVTGKVIGAVIQNDGRYTSVQIKYVDCNENTGYRTVWSTSRRLSKRGCRISISSSPVAEYVDWVASTAFVQNVRTADNSPDTCGNPEPRYRLTPNITIVDVENNYTINTYDGDNTEINVKPVFVENEFNADIDLEVPLNLNLGGIQVGIDLGGITFSGGGSRLPGGGKEPILPVPAPPEEEPAPEPAPEPNIDRYKREFPGDSSPSPGDESPETEEEQETNPAIEWVLVDIARPPLRSKTILQSNSSDNTYFAGYLGWTLATKQGSYRYTEQPIRKSKSAFKKPPEADGYRVYAVNGATLRITLLTRNG